MTITHLRDRIRIEIFYNDHEIGFPSIQDELESKIQLLQKLTHDFIMSLANNISEINAAQTKEVTSNYIKKYDKLLDSIYVNYGWILKIQPITIINKQESYDRASV